MKRIVLLVLAVSLVAVPTAVARKPPSFALWSARWGAHSDAVIKKATDKCNPFVKKNDDQRAGECIVAELLSVYPVLIPEWGRQVGAIAKPQSPKCRAAIHAYWLAARKGFAAFSIYLKGHRHTPVTQINQDSHDEPLATINALKDEAKSHAVRVCG
jgi:hypothetical protein